MKKSEALVFICYLPSRMGYCSMGAKISFSLSFVKLKLRMCVHLRLVSLPMRTKMGAVRVLH